MIAVDQGHKEVVRVILQQTKSDVHQVATDGDTVFSLAQKNGDEQVLKLLHQVPVRPPRLGNNPPHRPPPHLPPP